MIHKLIKWAYLRYVWPQECRAKWSEEEQAKAVVLEHAEFFRDHFSLNARLPDTGPFGIFLAELLKSLLVAGDGVTPPNFRECQLTLGPVKADLGGEKAERLLMTVQRCRGFSPSELQRQSEAREKALRDALEAVRKLKDHKPTGSTFDCALHWKVWQQVDQALSAKGGQG